MVVVVKQPASRKLTRKAETPPPPLDDERKREAHGKTNRLDLMVRFVLFLMEMAPSVGVL